MGASKTKDGNRAALLRARLISKVEGTRGYGSNSSRRWRKKVARKVRRSLKNILVE